MHHFQTDDLQQLVKPHHNSSKSNNGQLTMIAGSDLFHGPALFCLKIATRIVDMVFFSSTSDQLNDISLFIKSQLGAFIWIPTEDLHAYIEKSDAILIGPGLKRFHSENHHPDHTQSPTLDTDGHYTKQLTEGLLQKFSHKRWIIDGGSLQTIDPQYIPAGSLLTPNHHEYTRLFGQDISSLPQDQQISHLQHHAQKYSCHLIYKGNPSLIVSPDQVTISDGGNPGLTKGGTGDCLAGLTASLACKNPPHLSLAAADHIIKATADDLFKQKGTFYSSDDLANHVSTIFNLLLNTHRTK